VSVIMTTILFENIDLLFTYFIFIKLIETVACNFSCN